MNESLDRASELVREHQRALLHTAQRFFEGKAPPRRLTQAFMDTPRHLFTPRFYSARRRRWIDLERPDEDLLEHLPELYADHPLGIYRNENGKTLSTISQPSLVLYMLDLLDLQPGMRVFELGGGSGWNAAMMGRLVGAAGQVTSVEIIESLAHRAAATVERLGLPQVQIIAGDGSLGVSGNAPYQRGVYTASSWDLPACFYQQIEIDGLLLLVLKISAHADLLTLLRKTEPNRFTSEYSLTCNFVPVTGACETPQQPPLHLEDLEGFEAPRAFSWSETQLEQSSIPAFVEILSVVKDCQQPFLVAGDDADHDEEFVGFRSGDGQSLLLFNEDRIMLCGSEDPLIELRRAAKRWKKANCPEIEDLQLSISPAGSTSELSNDQWLAARGSSELLWGLK